MKTIFWNVDTQYDFMRNDESHRGALPVEGARSIENNLAKLTMYAARHGYPVVNTADWHRDNAREFSENPDFVHTFPPHCLIGSKGAEYIPSTAPMAPYVIDWRDERFDSEKVESARNIVLYKDEFDVFLGTPHVEGVLKTLNLDRAIVYGVATNYCVDFAVRGLLDRGVQVYAVTDAMKELPALPLEKTFEAWKKKGALFVNTQDVLGGRL